MRTSLLPLALAFVSLLSSCDPASRIERCSGKIDENSDGNVDCGDPACARHCDTDGDGVRDQRYRDGRDCDDSDPAIHPSAPEICNGLDDNCDGLTDESDPTLDDLTRVDGFIDSDLDGFGSQPVRICPGTLPIVTVGGDCDDTSPQRSPSAIEICNGLDDDCDNLVDIDDDSIEDLAVLFRDEDGDGYGTPEEILVGCLEPGWSLSPEDCADNDPSSYPGAVEVCDGIDNSCDGNLGPDEIDSDNDGDPVCTDCDDEDPARSSRTEERCNGLDDDCDNLVDTDDDTLNLYTCGPVCPEPSVDLALATPIHFETWNPCLLDPDTEILCSTDPAEPDTHTDGERLHRVSWRTDEGHWRDDLFLFLPPGPGRENNRIRLWAAYAGYRVLSLGYPNDDTIELACAGEHPDECYRNYLYEVTYGIDLSALTEITYADSLVGRLSVVLAHLAEEHPEMGFERYLRADGTPEWSRIITTGWSGGGGQAGFIAHYELTSSVVMMSAPKDHRLDPISPVDWIAAPSETPGTSMLTTWHLDEPYSAPPEAMLPRAWDEMGVPDVVFDIDENPGVTPPPGTHRLSQSYDISLLPMGCDAHASVGSDYCMRDEQLPGYLYLFCTASEL